jgi:hypothetical protein
MKLRLLGGSTLVGRVFGEKATKMARADIRFIYSGTSQSRNGQLCGKLFPSPLNRI